MNRVARTAPASVGGRKTLGGHGSARNATNPRIGSGMQQARELRAEKTGEVVRNHEVGTGSAGGDAWRPKREESPQKLVSRGSRRSVRCRWRGVRRTPRETATRNGGQGFGRIALERSEDQAGPHVTLRGAARTSRTPRGPAGRPARPRRARGSPTTRSWRRRGRFNTDGIFHRCPSRTWKITRTSRELRELRPALLPMHLESL
jgi:hypothetical protein